MLTGVGVRSSDCSRRSNLTGCVEFVEVCTENIVKVEKYSLPGKRKTILRLFTIIECPRLMLDALTSGAYRLSSCNSTLKLWGDRSSSSFVTNLLDYYVVVYSHCISSRLSSLVQRIRMRVSVILVSLVNSTTLVVVPCQRAGRLKIRFFISVALFTRSKVSHPAVRYAIPRFGFAYRKFFNR